MIVSHDTEGVRQAALEMMVHSLTADDTERQLENLGADPLPQVVAKIVPQRKLAAGYYDFAAYIEWLSRMLNSGIQLQLLADEAEGLRALQEARWEFERDHPACPSCGTRQLFARASVCRGCRMKFRGN